MLFRSGDVIVKYDGAKVEENDDLPLMVAQTPIAKAVEVELIRQGKKKTVSVTIKELKDEEVEEAVEHQSEESKLGLSVQDISPDIAKGLGLENTSGVIVTNVVPDSAADRAGLRRSDIIMEIGSEQINSTAAFKKATKDLKQNKPLLLLVKRNENTIFLTLKLE